tara:strand:+ start:4889 stop:6067 length:1179 start_codon:yes stop_codon:yes gene_type:complete
MQINLPANNSISRHAFQALQQHEKPHRKFENWRYTQLGDFFLPQEDLSAHESPLHTPSFVEYGIRMQNLNIENMNLPAGIREVETGAEDWMQDMDKTYDATNYYSLFALAASDIMNSFSVKAGTKNTFALTNNSTRQHAHSFRWILEENSHLDLVSLHENIGAQILENLVFYVRAGAELNLTALLNNQNSDYYGKWIIHLEEGTSLKFTSLDLNARKQKHEVHVFLHGENIELDMQGSYLLHKSEHVERFLRVHHLAPNSNSRQVFKGMLDDRSRYVFDGRVFVAKGADQTSAEQLNQNLALSSKAEVDTKPQLEIYADDVKCSHGATISRFLEEEAFYLQARAIDPAKALDMLARGFVRGTLANINHKEVQNYFYKKLEEKIVHMREVQIA